MKKKFEMIVYTNIEKKDNFNRMFVVSLMKSFVFMFNLLLNILSCIVYVNLIPLTNPVPGPY